MPDTTLAALKSPQAGNIRKILDSVVLVAPISAEVPETFTTGVTAALQALPTEYRSIGYVTKDDGYSWSRETDMAEVTSHGSTEPTRRDITSDVSGLAMTAQETSRLILELSNNVDLSALTPTAVTGELTFNRAVTPATRYWRLIAIGQDGVGDDLFYTIVVLPRAMISEYGDATWSDSDELTYPLTWSATPDPDLGYSYRQVLAGPGARARLSDMGFPELTP